MKWALVLSGGGARGLAHIGALQALEEIGSPRPDMIAGCSMGAIVGGLYASGMSVAAMKEWFGDSFDVTRCLSEGDDFMPWMPFSRLYRIGHGIRNLLGEDGIDSGAKLYKLLVELTKGKSFEETAIPFACNATDLTNGSEVVPARGLIADAIRASSSFPGVFSPFRVDGMLLADGYLCHNTPVWIPRARGIRNVLAIYLGNFSEVGKDTLRTSFDVVMRSLDCAVNGRKPEPADVPTASVNMDNDRGVFDFARPEEQIRFGYRRMMENRDYLEAFFARGAAGIINRAVMARKERKGLNHEQP